MTNKEFLEAIGIEIKVARVRKKMTIQQVAHITKLTVGSISLIEMGKKDSHILTYKRITDALEIDLKSLL